MDLLLIIFLRVHLCQPHRYFDRCPTSGKSPSARAIITGSTTQDLICLVKALNPWPRAIPAPLPEQKEHPVPSRSDPLWNRGQYPILMVLQR